MPYERQSAPQSIDKNALMRLQSALDAEEQEENERAEFDDHQEEEPEDTAEGASIRLPEPEPLNIQRALQSIAAAKGPEPEPESPEEEMSVEEILAQAEDSEDYDIFLDVGSRLADKGDDVGYSIKRSGRQVTFARHPYSYEQLQKEYGGGAYVIQLRSSKFSKKKGGGYIKTQSRTLEDPKGPPTALVAEKGPSAAEMLTMIQQMNDKARSESKAELDRLREESRAREERLEREGRIREERLEREAKERETRDREREEKRKNEGENTMMMFLKMMEQSNQQAREAAQRQSDLLITLLTKTPPEPKEDKRNEKMFDMLLSVIIDKKNKGESIDPIAFQAAIAKAEEKGYSRAKEIRELANEEAERLAARIGASSTEDSDDEEEKEESPTQTLLKTLTPLIAQMAAAPAAPQPPPQRMIARNPQPVRRPPVNPNAVARPPVVQAPQQAPRTSLQVPKEPAKQPTNLAKNAQTGLPRAVPTTVQVTKGIPVTQKPKTKEIVSEVVVNLMGADLGANFMTPDKLNPESVAEKALASPTLKELKVDARWLVSNFTLEDMKEVAKKKGLPDAVHPYLERFYKRVKTISDKFQKAHGVELSPEEAAKVKAEMFGATEAPAPAVTTP